ncbi:uncharacterized protein N7479_003572 [Penicillium vulpinum]|uniref:uncharacterized protein n=1 Tax=Penicillium vulpinum TaxID=29845 RepID=UPI002548B623|nr:uncharacterized protein N7479_003572 [Penicillium vulpinum]KAJ5963696.1 hypothetical protein N7479_003572 [Penicillium vulpinum]
MEPVSFAVGLIGLAGLFSTCLDAVGRFDSWKDYDSEFASLVAQFKAQKLRLIRWGLAVGLEDDEISYEHNALLDDPKIESTVKDVLFAIDAVCRDEDKAFLTSKLGKDEAPTKDQLFHRQAPRESKRQKLGWVLRTKAKRIAQVDRFSKLVETLHDLVPIENPQGYKGRKPTGDEYRRDLHEWLLGSTSTNDLYEIFSQRKIEGTCEWVLGQPWFLDWTSPDFPTGGAKILWINGRAGFGKSVICARVIDYLSSNSKDPVAHFFFSSDFESRRDPFIAIRSWLSQLIRHPVFFSLAREKLTTQQGQKATRGNTLELLRDLVMEIPRCTFILDGLDECRWIGQDPNSNDGASIVEFLEALRRAIAGTSTRILIVSRAEPEIQTCLFNEAGINDIVIQHSITPEDVRSDLEMFSRSIVNKQLSTKTETTKEDIAQKLAERCNGQFLWVQMQERQLRSGKSQKQLEKAINSTPLALTRHTTENGWESRIFQRMTENEPSPCYDGPRLLFDRFQFDEVPDSISESYIKTEIMELCGSLIELRSPQADCDPGSRTVHLAHFSVKEYLLCNLPVQGRLIQLNSSLESSTEGSENTLAAKMCLCYVECEEVWQDTSDEERNKILGSFLHYAAGSWYQHASFGDVHDSELVKFVNQLFDIKNPNWASWKIWFDLNDESQNSSGDEDDEDTEDDEDDGEDEEDEEDQQEIGSSNSKDDSDMSVSEDGRTTQTTSMSPLYYATWLDLTDTMDLLLRSKECPIDEQGNFGRTPLVAACERGNLEAAKKLLNNGANLDIAGDNEHTPLHTAACNGHVDIVRMLLEKGNEINNGSDGSKAPLYCACLNGHHQVAEILLQWKPDIITANGGWVPLISASLNGSVDIVLLLIERGADVNVLDNDGKTPLYSACRAGHIEVVRILLDKGADIDYQSQQRSTAIDVASYNGYLDIVLLLIERGADVNVMDKIGDTPLYSTCYEYHMDVMRLLLDRGADVDLTDKDGNTPLHSACYDGHIEAVRLLLDRGADFNVLDRNGDTPLYIACFKGHVEVLRLLLDKGADCNVLDKNGDTILYNACLRGHIEVVRLLLDKGATVNYQKQQISTAIDIALYRRSMDIVLLLMESGADVGTPNKDGSTPLHSACYDGDIEAVHLLLDKGANFNVIDKNGDTPLYSACLGGHIEVVRLLLDQKTAINYQNQQISRVMGIASYQGFVDIVQLLIERGADIHVRDEDGDTPIYTACLRGHTEVARILITKGADLEVTDSIGFTPLSIACELGFLEVITVLLEKGAAIESADFDNRTPLHIASLEGHLEVANLLLEKGASITSATKSGMTSLHAAILGGSLELVNLLLEKGAALKNVTKDGLTPLHLALLIDSLDTVNLLLDKGADIESVDIRLGTPLHTASTSSHLDVVNLLLERGAAVERGNFDDRTLLRYVSPQGQLEVINNFLRSQKLRIDIRVERGHTLLFYIVARGARKMARLLLPPLSPNAKDRYSVMRLLAAMRSEYEENIEKLATLAGLQSNLDGLGRDLIWWAIGTGRGRILGLIWQWCYAQNFGYQSPQASDDKLWSLVNLELGQICDVCTRPILGDTSYRRCEDCNNFNICIHCAGFKVTCQDTAHEWYSRELDGSDNDEENEKDENGDDN